MPCACIRTAALRLTYATLSVWFLGATWVVSTASAQPDAGTDAGQDEQDSPPSPTDGGQDQQDSPPSAPAETSAAPLEAVVSAVGVDVEGKMEKGERPTPPSDAAGEPDAKIVTGAGVGSDLAYASQFVVELGGTMAFTRRNDVTMIRLAQVIGWFVIDNLEISLLPDLQVIILEDRTEVAAGVSLEPSYHIPLSDQLLLFGGVGMGVHFAGGAEFVFRPRVGADLLIGRSGLLKPAVFLEVGTGNGLSAGGLEIGYTIML